MSRVPLDDMRRWLTAEAGGDPAADGAFREVFRLLPRVGPSASFADRAVEALRASSPRSGTSLWERVWLRPVTGLCLALTGLAVLGASSALPIPPVSYFVGTWVTAVTSGASFLGRAFDAGLSVWELFGKLAEAARAVAATPAGSLVLAGNGLLALAAFCGLRRLLSPREEMISW
jgi:hypothetical protein